MFSDHSGIKLEMDIRKIIEKSPKSQKLNNKLINNPWGKKVAREIKKDKLNWMKTKIQPMRLCETKLKQYWGEGWGVGFIALNAYIKKKYIDCVNFS